MQQQAKNKTHSTSELQRIFSNLLRQGLSYVEVLLKYNTCKQLYGKGTPAFYRCMGVNPPKVAKVRTSTRNKNNSTPHTTTKKSNAVAQAQLHQDKKMFYLAGLGLLILTIILLKRRGGKQNEVQRAG